MSRKKNRNGIIEGEQVVNLIDVSPVKREEEEISDYLDYLNNLAKESREGKSGETFYNKGEAHASLLMAKLLANTEKSLRMYCTGLRPGILCGKNEGDGEGFEGAYWKTFKDFFSKTNLAKFKRGSIKILIQRKDWIRNRPFAIVREAQKCYPDIIEIKWIRHNSIGWISKLLRGNGSCLGKNNFSVFDNRAYRIEYDQNNYLATGSFNDLEMCRQLSYIFDREFKRASQLEELNNI